MLFRSFRESNAQNIEKNEKKSDKWVLHKKNKNGNKLQANKMGRNKSARQTNFAKNRKQSFFHQRITI